MPIAAIIPAVIGTVGAVTSSVIGSRAAGKAADAQSEAAHRAIDLQEKQWEDQKAMIHPRLDASNAGLNMLLQGMGIGTFQSPEAQGDPYAEERMRLQKELDNLINSPPKGGGGLFGKAYTFAKRGQEIKKLQEQLEAIPAAPTEWAFSSGSAAGQPGGGSSAAQGGVTGAPVDSQFLGSGGFPANQAELASLKAQRAQILSRAQNARQQFEAYQQNPDQFPSEMRQAIEANPSQIDNFLTQSDAQIQTIDQKIQALTTAQNAGQPGGTATGAGQPVGFGDLMRDFTLEDFEASPGYQFNLAEGQKALDRSAVARGGLLSGRSVKEGLRYSQGLASNEFQNAFNRYNQNRETKYNKLAGLSGTGQIATQQLGQAGQNYANQAGNLMTQAGDAKASGYMGSANAWQSQMPGIQENLTDILGRIIK